MHALPLLNALSTAIAAPQTAAGTSTVTGSTIDCIDAASVMFTLILGTITATGTGTAKIQEGDDSGAADMADVSGLSISWTDATTATVLRLELTKITKRYARIVVTRATANTVLGGAVVDRIFMRKQPITQPSSVLTDFN